MELDLGLTSFAHLLRIKVIEEQKFVYDVIRGRYVLLQGEEMVRQLLIQYFIHHSKISKKRIAVERGLKIEGKIYRFDLLIYDQQGMPYMLVEVKSYDVQINEQVALQIASYNQEVKAPYLLISNGRKTYCCNIDIEGNKSILISALPI
jgi:hypothetical protein